MAKRNATLLVNSTAGTGTIAGLAPADITYKSSSLDSLFLYGGGGGNVFNVKGTAPRFPANLYAGAGDNLIKMFPGSYQGPLFLDGQGGTATLDYSAYASDVTVNLQLGMATDIAGGITNIVNVTGSMGNNILVGNGGNVLRGGNGRNLLIAGASSGTLLGGRDEDILIGGTTLWDTNPTMLKTIMAQWTRTDLKYAERIRVLSQYLNTRTVTGNGGGNTLLGGEGLDWFFASTNDTTDWDPTIGEQIVWLQ